MHKHWLIFILAVLLLAACGPSPEEQVKMTAAAETATARSWTKTPTVTPSPTPSPTATFTPTPTLTPTATEVPPTATEEGLDFPPPEDEPLAFWEDLPVMPSALKGEDQGDAYIFSTESSREEVKEFYNTELPGYGWQLMAEGEGDNGAALLMYMGENARMVTVSIFDDPSDSGLLFVMLMIV